MFRRQTGMQEVADTARRYGLNLTSTGPQCLSRTKHLGDWRCELPSGHEGRHAASFPGDGPFAPSGTVTWGTEVEATERREFLKMAAVIVVTIIAIGLAVGVVFGAYLWVMSEQVGP